MAQRHEIEAWVNPSAWDDPAEAERVIDAIEDSRSDDEELWTRLAGGGPEDQRSAAERDQERAAVVVGDELLLYRTAERQMEVARLRLHEALGAAMAQGHTAYRLAQVTGLSQAWIGRIRSQTHHAGEMSAWVERHYPGLSPAEVAEAMAGDVEALRRASTP